MQRQGAEQFPTPVHEDQPERPRVEKQLSTTTFSRRSPWWTCCRRSSAPSPGADDRGPGWDPQSLGRLHPLVVPPAGAISAAATDRVAGSAQVLVDTRGSIETSLLLEYSLLELSGELGVVGRPLSRHLDRSAGDLRSLASALPPSGNILLSPELTFLLVEAVELSKSSLVSRPWLETRALLVEKRPSRSAMVSHGRPY